jgi:hypothetical protein
VSEKQCSSTVREVGEDRDTLDIYSEFHRLGPGHTGYI